MTAIQRLNNQELESAIKTAMLGLSVLGPNHKQTIEDAENHIQALFKEQMSRLQSGGE